MENEAQVPNVSALRRLCEWIGLQIAVCGLLFAFGFAFNQHTGIDRLSTGLGVMALFGVPVAIWTGLDATVDHVRAKRARSTDSQPLVSGD